MLGPMLAILAKYSESELEALFGKDRKMMRLEPCDACHACNEIKCSGMVGSIFCKYVCKIGPCSFSDDDAYGSDKLCVLASIGGFMVDVCDVCIDNSGWVCEACGKRAGTESKIPHGVKEQRKSVSTTVESATTGRRIVAC